MGFLWPTQLPVLLAFLSALGGCGRTEPLDYSCLAWPLPALKVEASARMDLAVALAATFSEVQRVTDGAGERGMLFYDPTNQIAGLVLSRAPVGADVSAEEVKIRSILDGVGAVSGPLAQTFTTWDGFPGVRASYDQDGKADLKSQLNSLVEAMLPGSTGKLSDMASIPGPFKLQAEYVLRPGRLVVLLALVRAADHRDSLVWRLDDVAGGGALARSSYATARHCEQLTSSGASTVDFLWVVDNSSSMAGYQAAVSNASSVFGRRLGNADLSWRAAAVSTDGVEKPFTTATSTMQGFIADFGTAGSGNERPLESAQAYLQTLLPRAPSDPKKLRSGAEVRLILLGDADDQSTTSVSALNAFFANLDGEGGRAVVHGIVCPPGQSCSESQASPRRNLDVIARSGGVLADINIAQLGSSQLDHAVDAILQATIAASGRKVSRPVLASSLKVAIEAGGTVGNCNTADVPRSRVNGFDFDSATRRISFHGNCRPNSAGRTVLLSYLSWE